MTVMKVVGVLRMLCYCSVSVELESEELVLNYDTNSVHVLHDNNLH